MSTPAFVASRRPGLTIAGLAGGLLTVFNPVPRDLWEAGGYVLQGVWLGLALAVYFVIGAGDRSLTRAATIVGLSVGAYLVAFVAGWATGFGLMYAGALPPGFLERGTYLPPLAMFVSGVLGGFVLCGGTFLLYIEKRTHTDLAIVACALAGGLLGVGGSYLGDALRMPGGPLGTPALFLSWQTGIALVMGLAWPEAPANTVNSSDAFDRQRVPILVAIGVVVMAAPLGYSMIQDVRNGGRTRGREAAASRTALPASGAPRLVQRPIDDVMILTPIATRTARPLGSRRMLATETHPELMVYSACYSAPGGDACTAASVEVTEAPDAPGAKAALRRLGRMADPDVIQANEMAVEKFGHRVRQERVRPPDVVFYWFSDTRVIRVSGRSDDVDDILRAYLTRYPSSLSR